MASNPLSQHFGFVSLTISTNSILSDSLAIPGYAAALSILVLSIRIVARSRLGTALSSKLSSYELSNSNPLRHADLSPFSIKKNHIQELGGSIIFSFRIARLVACLTLLGLSTASLFNSGDWNHGLGDLDTAKWLRIILTSVYVCAPSLVSSTIIKSTLPIGLCMHFVCRLHFRRSFK